MKKIQYRAYLPDEDINCSLVGEVPQNYGGNWQLKIHTGWADLCGQDLITVESPRLFTGPISILISVSWICADFPKIFIIIISPGGRIKMCCIYPRTGTGKTKRGQPIDVWVNTNADNVELFLNGKSLGKKDMPRNSHLNWTVNYEPGTLSAIAYKRRKKTYCQSGNDWSS